MRCEREYKMKTDVYKFEKSVDGIGDISEIVTRAAAYGGLGKKEELRLTLLSEELVGMLPNLLMCGKGEFWIENKGKRYEVHAVVESEDLLSGKDREEILSVSASGKNAAAVGIMNKIRIAAEIMYANYTLRGESGAVESNDSFEFYDMGMEKEGTDFEGTWSLASYRTRASGDPAAWDELEKSIIANMADDVIVGIIGGKVSVTVVKNFG